MRDLRKLTLSTLAALAAGTTVATAQTTTIPNVPPVLPPPTSPQQPGGGRTGGTAPPPPIPGGPPSVPAPANISPSPPRAVPFEADSALRVLSETPYVLGSGDSVNIQVFNVPEFSGTFLIGVDGRLRLPFAEAFNVDGLTLDELTDILILQLEQIVQRPIVTVDLAQPRPIRVAIFGEIASPGSYSLANFPPLSEVVRGAGGITQASDLRRIRLTRIVGGVPEEIEVDLYDLLVRGNLDRDIRLRDGDRIFIPTLEAARPDEARLVTSSTVAGTAATGPAEIAVIGEVPRPGTYTVTGAGDDRPPTVTAAIIAAGGATNLSDLRSVFVRRPTKSGEVQIIPANLWETLLSGDLTQDIILQPEDTVVVPQAERILPSEEFALASASFSRGTINVRFIGEVNAAGVAEIPANTPLSQAILSAGGGFVRGRARTSTVELVRLNPNGTVTRRRIAVNFDAPINLAENPTLREGDSVIVGRNVLAQFTDTLNVALGPFFQIFSIINTVDNLGDDNNN